MSGPSLYHPKMMTSYKSQKNWLNILNKRNKLLMLQQEQELGRGKNMNREVLTSPITAFITLYCTFLLTSLIVPLKDKLCEMKNRMTQSNSEYPIPNTLSGPYLKCNNI